MKAHDSNTVRVHSQAARATKGLIAVCTLALHVACAGADLDEGSAIDIDPTESSGDDVALESDVLKASEAIDPDSEVSTADDSFEGTPASDA
jgi:hypothetical protein